MHLFELDAHRRGQSVAFAFRALQVRREPAPARTTWTARTAPAEVRRGERAVEPGAQLLLVELAAFVLVPLLEPLFAERFELGLREFAILVLIALLEEGWSNEHRRAEATRPAEPTRPPRTARPAKTKSAAAFRLHCLPFFLREVEVDGPHVREVEELGRRLGDRSQGGLRFAREKPGESRQENQPAACCERRSRRTATRTAAALWGVTRHAVM